MPGHTQTLSTTGAQSIVKTIALDERPEKLSTAGIQRIVKTGAIKRAPENTINECDNELSKQSQSE